MSTFRKEGMELVIENLKKVTDYDSQGCVNCYELEADCVCGRKLLWPIRHLILKLELENDN